MSTTVDQRVVEMRFDNKQFEANVSTTMSTLDKLKQSLNLSGASRGLENVSSAARGVDMSTLGGAVDTVKARFSALQVMAVTALANITNSALNAGKSIVSSLTIDPIRTGFQEYETQINSVQTILSNTSATTKQVVKQASAEAIAASAATIAATQEANDAALKSLKKTHKEQLKEIQKQADAELDILEDKHDDALELLEKAHDEELKAHEERIDAELDALDDKHEEEMELLEDAIDQEQALLKAAHQEKLDLYQEEYMEKLKVIDEERYNKIKAIDDQIDAINAQTEAEEKALELAKQNAKLAELQSNIDNATTYEAREKAEAKLAEYTEELARKQLLEERKATIDQLKLAKSNINAEYDAIEKELKAEYDAKEAEENQLYQLKLENLREEQAERKKALEEEHEEEKKLLKKTLDLETEAIKERHDDEIDSLRDVHEEEKKLLQEQLDLQKEAIQERQDAEIDALNASHSVAMQNLQAQHGAATVETVSVTPSTIEDVNAALDELNEYADKTIYNFTEMTRNIGTFTAAGVDLETAVSAIKGIANLAAASGSNSQQASTAMYQLSQAISTGTVKLMDWNSVVNAGMGGTKFQDALKATAREYGVAVDDIIAKNGSFRDSLQSGWLTADILNTTLKKFTVDGAAEYAKSMLESGKYTQEQADALMKEAQAMEDAATKVKTFTQLMDTLKEAAQSGWSQSWRIIIGDFEEAKEVFTEVSEVLGGFIGASADARNALLQGWKDLGGRVAVIEAIRNAFHGIISIITPIKEAFRDIFPPITVEQLLAFTNGLKDLTAKLKLSETTSENLKRTFRGLFSVLDIVKQAFTGIFKAIAPLTGHVGNLGSKILEVTASIGDWLTNLAKTTKETDIFAKTIGGIIAVISEVIGWVKDFASALFGLKTTTDETKTSITESMASIRDSVANSKFLQVMKKIWDGLKTVCKGIGDIFMALAQRVGDALSGLDLNNVLDIVGTASFSALALSIAKFVKNLSDPFEGLSDILEGVGDCLEAWQTSLKADVLSKIATSIGILAVSLLLIASINSEKLLPTLGAVTALFAELMGSMTLFSKTMTGLKGSLSATTLMIGISSAILILASALKSLSSLNPEQVLTGLAGVMGLITTMVATAKVMSEGGVKAVEGATKMIVLSAAIKVLASAVEDMATLTWDGIGRGLLGIAGALVAIVAAVNFMPANMASIGVGLLAVSAALVVVASAVSKMGGMTWEEIVKGLVALGGSIATLALGLNLMNGTLAGSAAMLVAATSLAVLTPALMLLGTMSWESIIKGLVAIAGAFTVLGVAGLVLAPLAPVIVSLAAALALIGVGVLGVGTGLLAAGAGLSAMAVGFTALAAAGAAGATAIVAALTTIITGVVALIPTVLTKLAEGIVAFAQVIANGAPVFGEAIKSIILTGIDVINTCVPAIVECVLNLLTTVLESLVDYTPRILEALGNLFVAIVKGIADFIPKAVTAVKDLLKKVLDPIKNAVTDFIKAGKEFINGIIQGIKDKIKSAVEAIKDFGRNIVQGIKDFFGIHSPSTVFADIGKNLIEGLVNGIKSLASNVWNAFSDMFTNVKDKVSGWVSNFVNIGKDMVSGLISGIASKASNLVESAKSAVGNAVDSVKNFLGIHSPSRVFAEIGRQVDEGFIVGIEQFAGKVQSATEDVGQGAIDGMKRVTSRIADAINENIDAQPTIKPVLDLSNVESGVGKISGMFSQAQAMTISASMNRNVTDEIQNGDEVGGSTTTLNFTQNNYSPKALSRVEIYRQTKNQFSAMKGMVKA